MNIRAQRWAPSRRQQAGFSYLEVLVTTVLVALVMVPALDALSVGVMGARVHGILVEEQVHLASALEEVLAQAFASLDTEALAVDDSEVATGYSDAPGTTRRRLVYLARYDGDNDDGDADRFTGGDDGLLWIRVELENTELALETLTVR